MPMAIQAVVLRGLLKYVTYLISMDVYVFSVILKNKRLGEIVLSTFKNKYH